MCKCGVFNYLYNKALEKLNRVNEQLQEEKSNFDILLKVIIEESPGLQYKLSDKFIERKRQVKEVKKLYE